MLTHEITRTTTDLASPAEQVALTALMTDPEAAVSDAPVFAPEAAGVLLLLALLSPKEPREPRDK